jgi:hypothetical protein
LPKQIIKKGACVKVSSELLRAALGLSEAEIRDVRYLWDEGVYQFVLSVKDERNEPIEVSFLGGRVRLGVVPEACLPGQSELAANIIELRQAAKDDIASRESDV